MDLQNSFLIHGQFYGTLSCVTAVLQLSVPFQEERNGMTENIVYPKVVMQDPLHSSRIHLQKGLQVYLRYCNGSWLRGVMG